MHTLLFGHSLYREGSLFLTIPPSSSYGLQIRNEGKNTPYPRPLKAHSTHVFLKTLAEGLTQSITGFILPGTYVQAG